MEDLLQPKTILEQNAVSVPLKTQRTQPGDNAQNPMPGGILSAIAMLRQLMIKGCGPYSEQHQVEASYDIS